MPQILQSRGFQGTPRKTQEAKEPMGGGFLGKLLTTAIPLGLGLIIGDLVGGGGLMQSLGGMAGASAGQAGIDEYGGAQGEKWAQPTNIQAGGLAQVQGPPPQQPQAQAQAQQPQASQPAQQGAGQAHDPMELASSLLEGWARSGRKA